MDSNKWPIWKAGRLVFHFPSGSVLGVFDGDMQLGQHIPNAVARGKISSLTGALTRIDNDIH